MFLEQAPINNKYLMSNQREQTIRIKLLLTQIHILASWVDVLSFQI